MPARYYRELLKFCLRTVGDRDVAADALQESYARVLAVQHPVERPRAFLRQVASNVMRDHWRSEKLRNAIFSERLDHPAGPPDAVDSPDSGSADAEPVAPSCWQPEERAEARQRLALLQRAIDGLPEKQREVFILYRFEDMPHADIARRLNISVRMVERHLQLAMLHCKRQVHGEPAKPWNS